MKAIKIGTKGMAVTKVIKENLASTVGSGSLEVFATPMMVALMEKSATNALKEFLEEDETTVGTMINVSHISATPLNIDVTATAEVLEINGREITFKVIANDKVGIIGEGTHKRFLVNAEKFMNKTNKKAN